VQAVGVVHETPLNSLAEAPAGLGLLWRLHVVPFQPSANGASEPAAPMIVAPTAVQALADGHETPWRTLEVAPVGFGVLWMAQSAPFQPSANVTGVPVMLTKEPTEMQAVDDMHDTASSSLSVAPVGFGVPSMAQPLPFQTSAKVTAVPALLTMNPTAVQAVEDVHDTPFRALRLAPVGLGVVSTDQLVPFHASANVTSVPVLLT